MKHLILAKFRPEITPEAKKGMLPEIRRIFDGTLSIDGVHGVKVYSNCVNRENRYDVMIELTMDRSALEEYDACDAHREWKNAYGRLLEKKAIFDTED